MRSAFQTTAQNVKERLFFRYGFLYLAVLLVSFPLAARGAVSRVPADLALFQFCMIPCALLGGLLVVSKLYLSLICALKAWIDAGFLYRVTRAVRTCAIGIWQWNACFFLLVFSAVLFVFSVSLACYFSFVNDKRDLKLIFSKPFGIYLVQTLFLSLFAFSLYFLFSRLGQLLPF